VARVWENTKTTKKNARAFADKKKVKAIQLANYVKLFTESCHFLDGFLIWLNQ
jgi:hypothetical protein